MTVRTPRIRQTAETCQVSHALAHEVISRYGEWTANQATSATQPTTVSYLGIIEFSNGTPSYGLNERQPLEAQYAVFASDYGYDIELARTILAAYANTIIRELARQGAQSSAASAHYTSATPGKSDSTGQPPSPNGKAPTPRSAHALTLPSVSASTTYRRPQPNAGSNPPRRRRSSVHDRLHGPRRTPRATH